MPLPVGSITPVVAFAAMAASTALPRRSRGTRRRGRRARSAWQPLASGGLHSHGVPSAMALLPPRLTAGYRAPMVGPRSVEERTMEAKARLHCWESMPKERLSEKLDRRIITGDRMMITHVYLKKGCLVPRHQHENEQITYVLEGALRFRLGADGAEQVDVRAGEVLTIPSNLPHSAEALEDTLDVDIFDPPRRDWLDGTDQ